MSFLLSIILSFFSWQKTTWSPSGGPTTMEPSCQQSSNGRLRLPAFSCFVRYINLWKSDLFSPISHSFLLIFNSKPVKVYKKKRLLWEIGHPRHLFVFGSFICRSCFALCHFCSRIKSYVLARMSDPEEGRLWIFFVPYFNRNLREFV